MKLCKTLLYVPAFLLGFISCDKEDSAVVIKTIDCIDDELVVYKGYTATTTVTVLPDDAEDKSYSWSVQNPEIASVSEDNVINGISEGETWAYVISNARPDEVKDSVKIIVKTMSLKTIQVTDERIHYEGRVVISDDNVQFFYPGTSFSLAFTGSSLYARFNAVECYYWVEIDDAEPFKISTKKKEYYVSDNMYRIAEGLKDGDHTAKITLVSEGIYKNPKFYGFDVDSTAEIKEIAQKPVKFEFIGNSITCGYGTEVTDRSSFKDSTSNFCHTFAYTAAQNYNAEIMVVARSGIGVYRNYGDSETASGYGCMPDNYEKLWLQNSTDWDFSQYIPDVLFINLGTNDTWEMSSFDAEKYKTNYKAMIDKILVHYPNVSVVLLTGSMMNASALAAVKPVLDEIQEEYNSEAHPFYRFDFPATAGTGADWHPCAAQQQVMGEKLIKFLDDNSVVK